MKAVLTSVFLLISLFCFSQTEKQLAKQQDSAAKNLAPVEDKAIVYIIRPTSFGSAIRMDVHCDSALVGTTRANSYLYTVLNPGSYTIKSKAENNAELLISVEAGKIYFVEQAVKMGVVYARAKLLLVDEEKGRKFLKKCKLSKSNELTAAEN